MAKTTTAPTPQYTRGQASSSAVLAELKVAQQKLDQHSQTFQPQLTQSLVQQVEQILPRFGVKKAPPELINRIAQDAAGLSLETLSTIQAKEQIGQVLADSVTQSIFASPEIAAKLKTDEVKAYEHLVPQLEAVAVAHAADLEKSAVLGNIAAVMSLGENQETLKAVVDDQAEQRADLDAPLSTAEERETAKTEAQKYVRYYVYNFAQNIKPEEATTLEKLQETKNTIYQQTTKNMGNEPTDDNQISVASVVEDSSTLLSLKPLTPEKAAEMGLGTVAPNTLTFAKSGGLMGFGLGLAMTTSPTIQKETFYSLLAYNNPKLDGTIAALASRQQTLKSQIDSGESLTFAQRLEFKNNSDRLKLLQNAKKFSQERTGRYKTYRYYFQNLPPGKQIRWASRAAWSSTQGLAQLPLMPYYAAKGVAGDIIGIKNVFRKREDGSRFSAKNIAKNQLLPFQSAGKLIFSPRTVLKNEFFMIGQTFGALSFGLGSFRNLIHLKSFLAKTFSPQAFARGMGVSATRKLLTRTAQFSGLGFGGLGLYFLGLGQAAFSGFLAGALAGGIAGAAWGGFIGFQIGVALAPLTFGLSIPIFTFLGGATGFFAGGAIVGTAAGLVAFGLASGSATAVSMGISTGIGGTVGAVVGFNIGAGIMAGLMTAAIGACIASIVCSPFAPILLIVAPAMVWLGGFIGAFLGGLIGSAIGFIFGYVIGHYIITPIISFFQGFGEWFGSVGEGIGGFSLGGFFPGLAAHISDLLGALAHGAIHALGSLSNGLTALFGGVGEFFSASALLKILGGSFLSIGTTSLIVGVTLGNSLFNFSGGDLPGPTSGDNEFFTIKKTASPAIIPINPPAGTTQNITFTIPLTPKVSLTGIRISDETKVQPKDKDTFTLEADKTKVECPQTLEVGTNCTKEIVLALDSRFNDSFISNTVTVNATPAGQTEKVDSTTAIATVGNPPAQCPRGWPLKGVVTQGPDGADSHSDAAVYGGYEAIDIANETGTDVYATVEGTVENVYLAHGDPLDRRIVVKTAGCPGLVTVNYWHLSQTLVSSGEFTKYGQKIGKSGVNGSGPHSHYQFNENRDRSFKIQPPYIPLPVPRTCNSEQACNVTIDKPLQ